MSNFFHVGQKVVGIKRRAPKRVPHQGEALPVNGCVYTIRGIDLDGFDGPSIWLEEIVNSPHLYFWSDGQFRTQEVSWCMTGFRPVIERKTDISIFTEMLSPNRREFEPALTEQV